MGPVSYALLSYALTAILSFAVVAIIVIINHLTGGNNKGEDEQK